MRSRLSAICTLAVLGVALAASTVCRAAEPATAPVRGSRILTFGGGPTPSSSQASLEQNVLYFRRTLDLLGLSAVHHDVYFTDGTNTGRTVQVRVKPTADVELRATLADLFGDDRGNVELHFRPAQITGVSGPSSPPAIEQWFDVAGQSMSAKDHLLVYFTGHGGPLMRAGPRGGRNPAAAPVVGPGTLLETWNNTAITTRDFVARLDKLNPDVEVTLVMVQCYSGGFANVIYNGGDPAKGLTKAKRCGFFSTIATRPAAGCTADIDGDEYEEFSTSFFAALSGKSRAGKAIEKPDYDKDGVTSFTEAFTYVLLTSNTIDIPMMTSDQLLRDKSRFARGNDVDLLTTDASYPALLAVARPSDKAALEGLSTQLGLAGDARLAMARKLAADIDGQRVDVQKTMRDNEVIIARARMPLRQTIAQRWPELAVRWHPDLAGVLSREGAQLNEALAQNASYKALQAAEEKLDQASDKDSELERKWVKAQRFIARAEIVALAANFEKFAPPEMLQAYHELLARENRSLAAWK